MTTTKQKHNKSSLMITLGYIGTFLSMLFVAGKGINFIHEFFGAGSVVSKTDIILTILLSGVALYNHLEIRRIKKQYSKRKRKK